MAIKILTVDIFAGIKFGYTKLHLARCWGQTNKYLLSKEKLHMVNKTIVSVEDTPRIMKPGVILCVATR